MGEAGTSGVKTPLTNIDVVLGELPLRLLKQEVAEVVQFLNQRRAHSKIGIFHRPPAAWRFFGPRHTYFSPFSLFVLFLHRKISILYRGIQNVGLLTGTPR